MRVPASTVHRVIWHVKRSGQFGAYAQAFKGIKTKYQAAQCNTAHFTGGSAGIANALFPPRSCLRKFKDHGYNVGGSVVTGTVIASVS